MLLPEQLHQLVRHHLVYIVGGGRIGVRGDIQLPQPLGLFGNIQLDGRLHGVEHHRVIVLPQQLVRNGELLFVHPLGQLQQQRLLVGKYCKKRGRGHTRCLRDGGGGGPFISVFQKQPDGYIGHPILSFGDLGLCSSRHSVLLYNRLNDFSILTEYNIVY